MSTIWRSRFVQRVEGVEELFLGALAAGEELHVVDDQQVDLAEAVLELVHAVATKRRDESLTNDSLER